MNLVPSTTLWRREFPNKHSTYVCRRWDKNFTISYGGEGDAAKTTNLNVYLWVGNVLNTRNINSVYRFTGVADDDGYLAAAQYQPLINSQNSPDAFRNYYSMFVDNPFNLGLPRTVRLGVKFDF